MGLWLRGFSIAFSLVMFLSMAMAGCRLCSPGSPLIGIIIWDRGLPFFAENLQGVMDGLREEGYQDGLNLTLKVVDAASDRDHAASAAQDLQAEGARLLITIGTVSTLVALKATPNNRTPILYSHVGHPEATGLAWPKDPGEARFTGTSSEVGAEEQLRFLLLAKPGLRRLGLLYCTATPVAEATAAALEGAAGARGLETASVAVPDDRPELLHDAMNQLISRNIEVLILSNDPVLVKPKNLSVISEQAMQAFLAVVGPTRFCVHHGAFMAFHSDPFEIGRQTGRQSARILSGAPLWTVPPEKPQTKRLTVNLKAAHKLDLRLSREFLSRAYHLYQ
jgi:putative ABC transport system substrate-binding protein